MSATDCALTGPPPYNCQGCDLTGRNLAGKNLANAQMQGATLTGTIFRGVVSLAGANLSGAIMGSGTDFSGCDLSTTDFGASPNFGTDASNLTKFVRATIPFKTLGTTWSFVDLTDAIIVDLPQDLSLLEVMQSNLTRIDFSNRNLTNAHFYGVVLRHAEFIGAILNNVVFNQGQGQVVCDLTDASFTGAELSNAVFDTSTLTRTVFTEARSLGGTTFLQTLMDGTRFDNVDVTTCFFSAPPRFSSDPTNLTSFRGATLNYSTVLKQWSYLDLTGATLVGLGPTTDLTYLQALYAVLTGMNFTGYTLSHCNLRGATLTGVSFSNAQMDDAVLAGVQNSSEAFRVRSPQGDYATFLAALQGDNGAVVAAIFTNYGYPIAADTCSVQTDDPNRWWSVTDTATNRLYPVRCESMDWASVLIVMDMSLVTRFDGARLQHANFSPNTGQPTALRGAIFNGGILDNADLSLGDFGPVNPHNMATAAHFIGASMNGVGLSQANLTGANLTGTVYLHNADMAAATLKGADLTGAQLGELAELFRVPRSAGGDYQDFLSALQSASVSGVAVIFGKFQHPIATGQTSIVIIIANRSWTVTDNATQTVYTVLNWTSRDNTTFLIVSTPTSAAALTGAYMPGATLVDANLYGVSAAHVQLYGSDVHLDGAILDNCAFPSANLGASSLIVKALYRVDLSDANLINATVKGADLTQHVTLSGANLQGADFTDTHMNGVNLANAAIAVAVTPAMAGVYLFGVRTTDPNYQPLLAELGAALNQVNITPDGDPVTIKHYIADLDNRDIAGLLAPFQQAGVTFSDQARIQPTADPEAWQILDAASAGTYTVWHGFDELGEEGLFARPSLPVLRQVFGASVAGALRWQASVTAGPAANQWLIDNDSENLKNLQLGYGTLLVTEDSDLSLAFYGTTLRIERLGDGNLLQIRTVSYSATILCPVDSAGVQQCNGDGSGSFFGADTICPNNRTLRDNQGSFPPVPWAHMLRALPPPTPPTCVPSPNGDCPQVSLALLTERGSTGPGGRS